MKLRGEITGEWRRAFREMGVPFTCWISEFTFFLCDEIENKKGIEERLKKVLIESLSQ